MKGMLIGRTRSAGPRNSGSHAIAAPSRRLEALSHRGGIALLTYSISQNGIAGVGRARSLHSG
jgi:hypothetical protein